MKSLKSKNLVIWCFAFFLSLGCSTRRENYESASYKRFKENKLRYEKFSEFYTKFTSTEISGIGFQRGIARRDPSSIIRVDSLYYVWYTRTPEGIPVVGLSGANDTLRAFPWDLADIYWATSPDGYNWTEQGSAVSRGDKGTYDARTVFTPDILVANGKYYLFYQAAGSLQEQGWSMRTTGKGGDFVPNVIGMSWSESPAGPWQKAGEPVLNVGGPTEWDGNVVHDPCLVAREGKFFLYYKSSPRVPWLNLKGDVFAPEYADIDRAAIGVAISDKPEGPYIKSEYNPVIIGGHECIIWPYRKGACAMLSEGPEKNSIQFSEDGINFYPVAHGIDVPKAAGTFRPGSFTDTDIKDGQGITWGLFQVIHNEWNYLKRFDCDLSLEKGLKKEAEYKKLQTWMNGDKE